MHIHQRNTSIQVCYNNMYVNINKNIQSGNTDNNKQSLSVHILLSLLHACARASCAVVHFLSNSSGQTQKCGNCQNKVTFNRFSSTCGRAGRSFQPLGYIFSLLNHQKWLPLPTSLLAFQWYIQPSGWSTFAAHQILV